MSTDEIQAELRRVPMACDESRAATRQTAASARQMAGEARHESRAALDAVRDDPSSRKAFLRMVGGGGAAALATLLAACGDDDGEKSSSTQSQSTPQEGALRVPRVRPAAAGIWRSSTTR